MMKKMKTKLLCKLLGGSHLYRLNTAESDIDERGVFTHLDPKYIIGTKRFDEERRQPKDTDEDVVVKELSHYCNLISKSNTEALDLLFCSESDFTLLTDEFRLLRQNRFSLIDSQKLFNCLRGYMQGERRLMNGERKGQIGGKRYAKLQEVGFSPKNGVQLLRLAEVGIRFFRDGQYFVDTQMFGTSFHKSLMGIKTTPENYTKDQMNRAVDFAEASLVDAFENRKVTHVFDEDKLNEILMEIYMPILKKALDKSE
jgi:hypothetical protein